MTEAALTILTDDVVATKSGGGIMTPATLGQPLIDRLDKAGVKFEVQMLESWSNDEKHVNIYWEQFPSFAVIPSLVAYGRP